MKACINCGYMLAEEAAYCNACNTGQNAFEQFEYKPAHSAAFLKVLCILTIVGAVFSLASIAFRWNLKTDMRFEIQVATIIIAAIVATGKLTGAIFMLKRKLAGLYIYTVCAIAGLISVLYSIFVVSEKMGEVIAAVGAAFTISFILAFLIMYWLPVNRRLLS